MDSSGWLEGELYSFFLQSKMSPLTWSRRQPWSSTCCGVQGVGQSAVRSFGGPLPALVFGHQLQRISCGMEMGSQIQLIDVYWPKMLYANIGINIKRAEIYSCEQWSCKTIAFLQKSLWSWYTNSLLIFQILDFCFMVSTQPCQL